MSTPPCSADDMRKVLEEYQLAKRALRWMVEHQVMWSWRMDSLVRPVSMATTPLTAGPPLEVLAFIHAVAREADLEAEHAG